MTTTGSWSSYETGDDNACGVQAVDSEDYWYMGYTECFRANAAYTLYGVLSGEADTGCNSKTYINSFFTTSGVEIFTSSMISAGLQFSDDDGNADNGDGVSSACEQGGNDGSSDSSSYIQKVYAGYTSYGVGCSGRAFAEKSYAGAYCDNNAAIAVTDDLTTFNQEITAAQCIPIYNSGQGATDSLQLLYYSKACSVREFAKECPDPYGKLAVYSKSLDRSTGSAKNPTKEKVKKAFTWILLILGVMLLVISALIYRRKSRPRLSERGTKDGIWRKMSFRRRSQRSIT
jgi:hypothetical protein